MSTAKVYIGLDVSKDHLDVASTEGSLGRFAYDGQDIAQLIDHLRPLSVALLVLEATGGLRAHRRC